MIQPIQLLSATLPPIYIVELKRIISMVEKEARTETREDFIAYRVDAAGILAPSSGCPEQISQHSLFLPYLTIIFNLICVLT
ncbi:hypothetical protein TH62_07845 [Bacillus sp. TH008]|nr:hypothetical protein TH62_07845 [Bacillus sp. TH008]